jgi:hypothetical protein
MTGLRLKMRLYNTAGFHSFIDDISHAVAFLHCGVSLSECRLMVSVPVLRFQDILEFLSINFSSTFEIVGIKLIGRWDETSIGFFSCLGIIIICAIFNDVGQYLSRSMALNVYIRCTGASFGIYFSILAVIKSSAVVFFSLKF